MLTFVDYFLPDHKQKHESHWWDHHLSQDNKKSFLGLKNLELV